MISITPVLALASAVLAVPLANTAIGGRFSVQQVAQHRAKRPSHAHSVLKTFNKYAAAGAQAPQKLLDAVKEQGSVNASDVSGDTWYAVPVTVGTPGQRILLDFDTGSSDLWISSCLAPPNETTNHQIYEPALSTSAKPLEGEYFAIIYGDQSGASGVVYSDTVTVGSITATSQAIGAATSLSAVYAEPDQANGVLGLSFAGLSSVSPDPQAPFFDNIKDTLSQKLFTVDLKHNASGSYDFGFIDQTKYRGNISYVPVDSSDGYWIFTAGRASTGLNGTLSGFIGPTIPDTGTSLIYVPDLVVRSYYENVSGASVTKEGLFVVPCDSTLPAWNADIGGQIYTVPGRYINFARYEPGTCLGALQSSDGLPASIFGDTFLKTVFAIHDQTQSQPRVGFAQKSGILS